MAVFKGHRDVIYSVSFSGDGTIIASGSADKTLRLWAAAEAVSHADAAATPGESADAAAEVAATTFELAAFPTKSTPILTTMFSRRNMLFAAGLFVPNT
jgi:transcription initiation factor TFIID subunit 5